MKVVFNQAVIDVNQAPCSPDGWLAGAGIFETIKVINSEPQFLNKHYVRAQETANALSIRIPSYSDVVKAVEEAVFGKSGSGMLRISFSQNQDWLVAHFPHKEIVDGASVRVHPEAVPGQTHKLFPYTNRIAILNAAREAGFDDAITVNSLGNICEGSVTNFVANIQGQWITPPTSDGVLPGIIRQLLIDNQLIKAASISLSQVQEIKSAFLLSSLRLAHPISRIDNRELALSHSFMEQIRALVVTSSVD